MLFFAILHVTDTNDIFEELIIKMIWCRYIFHLTSLTWLGLYAIKSDVVTILWFSSFCMTKQMPSSVILF